MSSELQVLDAFRVWHGVARTIHPDEALPTGDELIAAAGDHTELNPGGNYPALLVWADALKQVRALALTDNTEVIPTSADLYRPNLDPVEEYTYAEVVEEPVPEPVGEAAPAPTPAPTSEPTPDPEPDIAPESEPVSEPEPEPVVVEEQDVDLRPYQPHEFRMLDGFADVEPIPGAELWLRRTAVGDLELEWDLPDGAAPQSGHRARLFRVVSEEHDFEQDPELGEPRVVTVGHRWVDTEPLTTAYRMYQVWMHEGTSETSALRSEPQLVGQTHFILPIEHIDLSVAGSVVKGQWSPQEHTHRVAVFAAQSTERRTRAQKNEIATVTQNLQGFRHTPELKGVRYKFVAQRYVLINGDQLASAPSEEFEISVPAEVVEVPIDVEESFDGFDTGFTVSWENPNSGEVRIYRTEHAPASGLGDRIVEVEMLESFGLAQRDWTNDLERGMSTCQVDWPDDWYSVFLTPVSVVGNQARVGRSHSRVRVGEITNARLHERVNNQLLTFGWPEEAHEVTAVFGARGTGHRITPGAEGDSSNIASIHRQAYEDEGGMRIHLPAAGGDIALFPSRVYEGRQIWGEPVVLKYDGLRIYRYAFEIHHGTLHVVIRADREEHVHRSFTLRLQQGRLPLEQGDGTEVKTRRIPDVGPADVDYLPGVNTSALYPDRHTERWELNPEDLDVAPDSFLRLFAWEESEQGGPVTVLIDPNPVTLELDAWRDYLNGQG